jgi:hypothetical protein
MELFTLRLRAPLSWAPAADAPADVDPGYADSGIVLPALLHEGSEAVLIWDRDQLVSDSDDGPRLRRPVPPPRRQGLSADAGDASLYSSPIVLTAGSYLFCQGRLTGITSIEQTLEWFFRETWWTRAECRGPVHLRLVREDGKTAVQVIMESAKQE